MKNGREGGVVILLLLILNGCLYNDSDVTSSQCSADDIAVNVTTRNASSCESADGSITASINGGVGEYTFSLNSGTYQADSVFSNLSVGSYTITVKDAKGCTASQIASLNSEGSTLMISVSTTANSGCPTANGTLTVTASGGAEPYQYKINSGSYQSSNTFTGLAAGTYTVAVTDGSGCPVSGSATIVREGPGFSADISPIISTKCAISGCHNGSKSPKLTTYTTISGNASRIKSEISSGSMPPSNSSAGSLTQTQINLINCWISDGALNN